MKITGIAIYRTDLPYVGGAYGWDAGNVIRVAQATVVVIETDAGISGCGEFTPCGENYMVANSEGAAAVANLLAPALIGEDPRQVARIYAQEVVHVAVLLSCFGEQKSKPQVEERREHGRDG